VSRILSAALVALVVGAAGCKAGEARLTEPEIEALEARAAALAESAAGSVDCRRPVLRGEPAAGSGTEAARALFEHADCFEAVRDLETGGESAVQKTCAAVIDGIGEAVRYGSACGPTVDGPALGDMDTGLALARLARVAAIEARHRADDDRAREAAEILLDAAQLAQDFRRGPATLLEEMIADSALRVVLDELERMVLEPGALSANELAEVGRQLGVLRASGPQAATLFSGEQSRMLEEILAGERGAADLAGALAIAAIAEKRGAICPDHASFAACAAAWDAVARDESIDGLGPIANGKMRALAEDALRDGYGFAKYVRKVAASRAQVVALETAARALGEGLCPPPPFEDPALGFPIQVETSTDRVAMHASIGGERHDLVELRCPDDRR
jgi:hypothetical protein